MKLFIILLCVVTSLYAPYDPDFYIRGKKVNRAFFIRFDPRIEQFVRIRVKDCVVDTLHVQPERSKRKDHESGCGALNITEM